MVHLFLSHLPTNLRLKGSVLSYLVVPTNHKMCFLNNLHQTSSYHHRINSFIFACKMGTDTPPRSNLYASCCLPYESSEHHQERMLPLKVGKSRLWLWHLTWNWAFFVTTCLNLPNPRKIYSDASSSQLWKVVLTKGCFSLNNGKIVYIFVYVLLYVDLYMYV